MKDCDALLNFEDVLVGRPIGALLFLRRVPVKIYAKDFREGTQQRISHSPQGWVVDERVIGNQTQDTAASLVDLQLRQPEEFDVIVLKDLFKLEGTPFLDGITIHETIRVDYRSEMSGEILRP